MRYPSLPLVVPNSTLAPEKKQICPFARFACVRRRELAPAASTPGYTAASYG
jgi:hypothetical protein